MGNTNLFAVGRAYELRGKNNNTIVLLIGALDRSSFAGDEPLSALCPVESFRHVSRCPQEI